VPPDTLFRGDGTAARLVEAMQRPQLQQGIYQLYRQRAEELRRGEAARQRRVRLRVPQGVGHRNMLLLNVAADGTCEMTEEDAESFLRAGWVKVDAGDGRG
jgi:hypothetical protein